MSLLRKTPLGWNAGTVGRRKIAKQQLTVKLMKNPVASAPRLDTSQNHLTVKREEKLSKQKT